MTEVLILIGQGGGNWNHERWKARLAEALPDCDVKLAKDGYDPASIDYACVWKPPPGALAAMPRLKAIFNFGAGVDALLADTTLPAVPVVRAVNDNLTMRMSEYVVLHVLMHHRQQRLHDAAQARREWISPDQWSAADLRVGVMGTGVLGRDAMRKLAMLGFPVAGWSRSAQETGFPHFAGAAGLPGFLARSDVLVVLLPATPETDGILNRKLFSGLARNGPLAGPVLINAGRGALQNENDILSCLNDGTLKAATLDVFRREPLPADHPLWRHPSVTLTPHNAADSDPDAIAAAVARQIKAHLRGEALTHVVDRATGY